MGSTSVAALIIKKSLDTNISQSLNERLKPAIVINIAVAEQSVASDDLRFENNKMFAAVRC